MRYLSIPIHPSQEQHDSCRRHHPGAGPGGPGPGGGPPWSGQGRGHGHRHGPRSGMPGGGRGRSRAARGQLRAAVLLLLAERPRHGYELITELTDRSDGRWNPSPGAVYPMVRRMVDKGLVTVEVVEGRKTFSLTPVGEEYVAEHREGWGEPWSIPEDQSDGAAERLITAARQVMAAAGQVLDVGSEDQHERAEAILARTRRELFGLLAEGE